MSLANGWPGFDPQHTCGLPRLTKSDSWTQSQKKALLGVAHKPKRKERKERKILLWKYWHVYFGVSKDSINMSPLNCLFIKYAYLIWVLSSGAQKMRPGAPSTDSQATISMVQCTPFNRDHIPSLTISYLLLYGQKCRMSLYMFTGSFICWLTRLTLQWW